MASTSISIEEHPFPRETCVPILSRNRSARRRLTAVITHDVHPQMEASDNGYQGDGTIGTTPFRIQVGVRAINDAPVVLSPPESGAVPGEVARLPGFSVRDPDTDTDGKLLESMQRVRARDKLSRREEIRNGLSWSYGPRHSCLRDFCTRD